MPSSELVLIRADADIVIARQKGRALAAELGFSSTDQAIIATAISELARNMVEHAHDGEIVLDAPEKGRQRGVRVVARDQGPGIPDVEQALKDGFSTGKGLGLGLPGTRRLMDEFEIVSRVGVGTTVTATKWRA